MDHCHAANNHEEILPRPKAGPLPPLLPCPIEPRLMGSQLAGCHCTHPRSTNAVDTINDLCRLFLDSQIPASISFPPIVEDSNATQVRVLDN